MDPQLVENIVHEVKSQGVFDEFRKDSMADVDTKPAYQNLRQRVENTVRNFLADQKWTPETNKNQLRERLRRHITESGFLDVGVERIVDQVVNPKICTIFQPRIEDIAYKYLGIPLPPTVKPPPPPLIHPLPPLPLNSSSLKVEIANSDLLPTDLEQVSPDSDKATVKSEIKEEDTAIDFDDKMDDEDESPPFEPVGRCKSPDVAIKTDNKLEVDAEINGPSVSPVSRNSKSLQNNDVDETQDTIRSIRMTEFEDASRSLETGAIQESQLSQVSSDSQVSHETPKANELDDENKQSSEMEPAACNISEEAQMPKFSENSSDNKRVASGQLHFDIKKDEIKFEGTERKSTITPVEQENASGEEKPNVDLESSDANPLSEKFRFNAVVNQSQLPSERSVCSSQDDSSSMHLVIVEKPKEELDKESSVTAEESSSTQQPQTQCEKIENAKQSSSSTPHKRHSKDKYRSHDREKQKDREKDKEKDRQKDSHARRDHKGDGHRSREHDRSKDKHSRSSKHSSSSSKHSSSTTTHRHENGSGSKSDKSLTKSSHSSSSSSSSRGEKRNDADKNEKNKSIKGKSTEKSDRKTARDDHSESKEKTTRRRSNDSNDEDKGSTTPASGNGATSKTKAKSSNEPNGSSNSSSAVKGSSNGNVDATVALSNENSQQDHTNRIVILNEILENPATSFIEFQPDHMEVVMTPEDKIQTLNKEVVMTTEDKIQTLNKEEVMTTEDKIQTLNKEEVMTTEDKISNTTLSTEDNSNAIADDTSSIDLQFFEKTNDDAIVSRLKVINTAVSNCRQVINNLNVISKEADSATRIVTRCSKRMAMMATLHVVDCQLDYKSTTDGKNSEESLPKKRSKLSPTTSETSSTCSKENEDIVKNTIKDVENAYFPVGKQLMADKSNQQQRYNNNDLYKSTPNILSQRSKRRAVVVDSFI